MNEFDNILCKIKDGSYKEELSDNTWGGAGIIIIPDIADLRGGRSTDIICVTPHAAAVIWLINQLKLIAKIDYLSKYEFYARIAETTNQYGKEKPESTEEELLVEILNSVSCFLPKNSVDIGSVSIARTWFTTGKNQESLFRFMAYWVAFNFYYSQYTGKSERNKIVEFCDRNERILLEKVNFNKIQWAIFEDSPVHEKKICGKKRSRDEWKELYKKSIYGDNGEYEKLDSEYQRLYNQDEGVGLWHLDCNIKNHRIIINRQSKDKLDVIKALLKTIYQVRCNLFHGSKNPYPERNKNLIEESANVLEMIISEIVG